MKRNLLIAIVILTLGVGTALYLFYYEAPEECFAREMRAWSIENELEDKAENVTQENAEMAVARAKFLLNETNIDDYSGDTKKIYVQIGTLFEYCNVNN